MLEISLNRDITDRALALCKQNLKLLSSIFLRGFSPNIIGSREFIEILLKKISLREGFGNILAEGTIKAADSIGKGAGELIGDSITTSANYLAMYDPRLFITDGLLYATKLRKRIQQIHEISMLFHEWVKLQGIGVHDAGNSSDFLSPEDICAIAEKFWGSQAAGN